MPIKNIYNFSGILETIENLKNNMYSKDTWTNWVIIDRKTGTEYTLGEIDKLINN